MATKPSRWGRLRSSGSEPRTSPTHAKLSKTVSEAGPPKPSQASAGGVTVHVTKAELSAGAKPEAKQPEVVALGDLRRELHAVTEQMQRVEARLDAMFRMFSTFVSGSGLKAGPASADMTGVEVVDLTGGVVRRSPDPRSRGNSVDMTGASVFSSRLNSITSENDIPVMDAPSNNTISTDAMSTLSPPPAKPTVPGSPAKHPTLVRVRPLPAGQVTGTLAAMENPGFVASPDAHPLEAAPTRQARRTSTPAERPLASDDQRTTSASAQPVTSVCQTTGVLTPTSGLTTSGLATFSAVTFIDDSSGILTLLPTSGLPTSAATVSGSSATVARSSSVNERLSVGALPASISAPSAEGITNPSPARSPLPPGSRRRSGAGSSPAGGREIDPRLRTTLV